MSIVAVGLSQNRAPRAVFERCSLMGDRLGKALTEVGHSDYVTEAAILATCNRTEIYVRAERFHDAYHDIRDALGRVAEIEVDEFVPHLYVHYAHDAVQHLFRVAAGLDSVVVGEHEILGQVRTAWDEARVAGASGAELNLAFQRAVEVGKLVRTVTAIGAGTTSLPAATVDLVRERRDLVGSSVALVGAGEVGRGAAAALAPHLDRPLTVLNRTPETARSVAEDLDGRAVPLEDLARVVAEVDVVVCATAAPAPVLTPEVVAHRSTSRPLLVVDLAVPPDVAPELADHPALEVLALSEVQRVANRGLEDREGHRRAAEELIEAELERYRAAASAQQVSPLIGALHRHAESIRLGELERFEAKLAGLDDQQRNAVEALTRRVVATLLHDPTVELKSAAGSPKGERLTASLRELFDLDA